MSQRLTNVASRHQLRNDRQPAKAIYRFILKACAALDDLLDVQAPLASTLFDAVRFSDDLRVSRHHVAPYAQG